MSKQVNKLYNVHYRVTLMRGDKRNGSENIVASVRNGGANVVIGPSSLTCLVRHALLHSLQ